MRRPASEEGYEFTRPGDEAPAEFAPQAAPTTPWEWARKNLFSSTANTLLTVVTAAVAVWGLVAIVRFVLVDADWQVLDANLRVYMVGRFPVDELWRVWVCVYAIGVLVGSSRAVFPRPPTTMRAVALRLVVLAVLAAVVFMLVESSLVLGLIAGAAITIAVAYLVGRWIGPRLRGPLIVAWLLAFPFVIIVLRAFDGVQPARWGGFLLNLIVAVVAIFVSFPIGLLLALGRRSTLPAIRTFSIGMIEFIRGVPLLTLIVFGVFALPLLLPPGLDLPNIVLAMIMFVIFSSVYVAEIVRGGLQGVADGQFEAAEALGFRYGRMMGLVILPQALRNTIPAMISHFISLFKDTSLLAGVGLFSDLLSVAGRATRDITFVGREAEALLPAAFIFWFVAFSMARWSQRVERRVGVGER